MTLPPDSTPTREEQDYIKRLQATMSAQEMIAIMLTAPPLEDDIDIVDRINDTRRLTGIRMPDPPVRDE